MKKSTDELLKILKNKNNYADYSRENKEEFSDASFTEMLEEILLQNGVSKSQAIDASLIERHYAYQIFNGTKTPSRDKLIMLCFGMKADLEQTKKLLNKIKAAPLYPRDRRDSIIIYGLLHGMSIMDVNFSLQDNDFDVFE